VNEQCVTEELRTGFGATKTAERSDAHTGAIGLTDLLADAPSIAELVQAFVTGFESEFETDVRAGSLREAEEQSADQLVSRYSDPSWTWRR
jgi:lipoate-protein ligase A